MVWLKPSHLVKIVKCLFILNNILDSNLINKENLYSTHITQIWINYGLLVLWTRYNLQCKATYLRKLINLTNMKTNFHHIYYIFLSYHIYYIILYNRVCTWKINRKFRKKSICTKWIFVMLYLYKMLFLVFC